MNRMHTKNAAVFLDRDGTINEEVGYLDSMDKLSIFPAAFDAVRIINEAGMKVVVVTNQSGVARGFFDEAFVKDIHERMKKLFLERDAVIDRFYYCPHHPTEGGGSYRTVCDCRKPKPGMLLKASAELGIDLSVSYVVGDTTRDIELARRCEATGILVRTGYGKDMAVSEIKPAYVADDILAAARWIVEDAES